MCRENPPPACCKKFPHTDHAARRDEVVTLARNSFVPEITMSFVRGVRASSMPGEVACSHGLSISGDTAIVSETIATVSGTHLMVKCFMVLVDPFLRMTKPALCHGQYAERKKQLVRI
jgi:hypothetical protein